MLFPLVLVLMLLADACQADLFSTQPLTITTSLHASFTVGTNRVPTAVATSNVSQKCLNDTEFYINALFAEKTWATAMYESSGRLSFDLLSTGSTNVHHDPGLFDDCLEVSADGSDFLGQYCSVFFKIERIDPKDIDTSLAPVTRLKQPKIGYPTELHSNFQNSGTSFCLPSSCSAIDLRTAVAQQIGLEVLNGTHSVVTLTDDNYCFSKAKKHDLDWATIVVMAIFACLFMTVFIATMHEIYGTTEKNSILNCFSLIRNVRILISTESDIKDNLSCLHGLRVISTFFIVFLHVADHGVNRSIHNRRLTLQNSYRWDTQLFSNGLIAVDTFFLISGLLVAYTQLRHLTVNKGKFGLVRFYARRWLRVTPLFAAVVAVVATVYAYCGTGPDWHYVRLLSRTVREYWWTYMLYIYNYYPRVESYLNNPLTGFSEAWYLACDMQMFWLSPLFIYPLWRWRRCGLVFAAVTLVALLAANVTVFIIQDLPATLMYSRPSDFLKANDYFRDHYMQTYARFPPYLIGIVLGWILYNTKAMKRIPILNRVTATIGWLLAVITGGLVIFGLIPYLNEQEVPVMNPVVRVSYGALHRAGWGLVMGWVVFACSRGYGGFVHGFLSWRFFLPFSRLAYGIYLIHYSYIRAFTSQSRAPIYFSEMYFFTIYLGCLFVIILLAAVAFIFIELPFSNLERLVFSDRSKNTKTKRETDDQKTINTIDAGNINKLPKDGSQA